RGLIRFDMPASLTGRATVTSAQLQMTTIALGGGSAGTKATMSLQALTQSWVQGTGFANSAMTFVVGQLCTTGATWNQANCATATNWTSAGGSVSATISATAEAPDSIGATVSWS